MNIVAKIEELKSSGIELWVEGSKLRFKVRKGEMTPEVKDFLTQNKPEVIACLRIQSLEAKTGLREQFKERAAIREYDGRIPRVEAEHLAIRDVFDMLPGQDRNSMTPEEFQAAVEVFAMLAKARDERLKEREAGRPGRTFEPDENGVRA